MPIHVAILKQMYLQMVLSGEKTVESRLRKTRGVPWGEVVAGERLFLKASGGPFMATAVAGPVHDHADLDPRAIMQLGERWDEQVCGGRSYWEGKADARFATLIELRGVEPLAVGPRYDVQNMRAWYVLEESASPVLDVTLTGGALRNRYLILPPLKGRMQRGPFTLVLPDGREVETEVMDKPSRVRWRGWGPYYDSHRLTVGDRVRLTAIGNGRYAVGFKRRNAYDEPDHGSGGLSQ